MKLTYDAEADALYVSFQHTTVTTKELSPGIFADYSADGTIVGIEVLEASRRIRDPETLKYIQISGLDVLPQ